MPVFAEFVFDIEAEKEGYSVNLFAIEIHNMQEAAVNLMSRLAQLELAGKGIGMSEAYRIMGLDGPLSRKDVRLKLIVVTGQSQVPGIPEIHSILREHVLRPNHRGGPLYLKKELESLAKVLNFKVGYVMAHPYKDGEPWRLRVSCSPGRNVANALIDYLSYFYDPRMLEHDPIAICPHCEALFLKVKSSQEFCSAKCRQQQWYNRNSKEYYSTDARKKRKQLHERQMRRKRKEQ